MLKGLLFFIQIVFISFTCLFSQSAQPNAEELQSQAAMLYEDKSDSAKYKINSRVEDLLA